MKQLTTYDRISARTQPMSAATLAVRMESLQLSFQRAISAMSEAMVSLHRGRFSDMSVADDALVNLIIDANAAAALFKVAVDEEVNARIA